MITVNMTNKFLKLNRRQRKKKINLMIRTMIQTALLHIGVDSGPVIQETKRSYVPFATADVSGKQVTFTFYDEM